jgi:hypothetical protein
MALDEDCVDENADLALQEHERKLQGLTNHFETWKDQMLLPPVASGNKRGPSNPSIDRALKKPKVCFPFKRRDDD